MPYRSRQDSPRSTSRRWLGLVLLLLVLAVGAAAAWRLRPRGQSAAPGLASVTPIPGASSTAAATAAVLPEPSAAPEDTHFHPPKVLASRPVSYPEQALLNRIEGTVGVKFSIDDAGHVINVVAARTSGSVMLDAVVLERDLRNWTFTPANLDGKPVPGTLDQEFEFHLDPKEQQALAEARLASPIGTPDAPYPKEALALKPQGSCTVEVTWTAAGLVDRIILTKSSGSGLLDRVALRFAFVHWRIDPKDGTDKDFTKTMTFTPPAEPNDTPAPL